MKMSIENFRNQYNIPDLIEQISKEKDRFPQMSSPAFLAMKLADFGAEGLKEEEVKLSNRARLYLAETSSPYPISNTEMERVAINYSAISFGLSLEFMDGALLWGVFDKPGFVREHNKRTEGSRFYRPLYSDLWEAQVIENDYLKQMRDLALQDKTLSFLFQKGYPLMPHFIQRHVGYGANLALIRRSIIPVYFPLAQRLVVQ